MSVESEDKCNESPFIKVQAFEVLSSCFLGLSCKRWLIFTPMTAVKLICEAQNSTGWLKVAESGLN